MIIMTIFRFPINFKSEVEETSLLSGRKFFYHVVLGIAYKGGNILIIVSRVWFSLLEFHGLQLPACDPSGLFSLSFVPSAQTV